MHDNRFSSTPEGLYGMRPSVNGSVVHDLASIYLPNYQFYERHEITPVAATADAILDAVENYDDRDDPVLDALLKVREFPSRALAKLGLKSALTARPRFGLNDFLLLERSSNQIAFGLVGRFWRLDFGLIRLESPSDFKSFSNSGAAKLVMTFSVLPNTMSSQLLRTETRIWCPNLMSKAFFMPYWIVIRIASGWIRRRVLAQIQQNAEKNCDPSG